MIPKQFIVIAGICGLFAISATGQDKDLETKRKITGGMTRRISEILGGANLEEEAAVELSDVASSIEMALLDVDPEEISTLNDEKGRLLEREDDISSQLEGLRGGLTIDLSEYATSLSPTSDITPESLEIERDQLRAMQVSIKELELRRDRRQAKTDAINDAKTMTPLSAALLGTLEDMPELIEAPVTNDEDQSEFPARMAHALFRTGDFVGAIKHFRMIEEDQLTPRNRYEMARSLEETGETEKALSISTQLMARTLGTNNFWHQRAKNLEKLLKTVLGLNIEDTTGKDS